MAGANIYGELIRGQLHNSSSDLSNAVTGLIYANTSTHEAKVYLNSGWKTLADLSTAQTFTNKTHTSPVLNTSVSGTAVLDEDDMASNSDTKLATQQSIKAYVNSRTSNIVYTTKSANYVILDNDGYRTFGVTGGSGSFTFATSDVSTGGDTITETAHGMSNGTPVMFESSAEPHTLPAPLVPGTVYFVVGAATDTFQVASTIGGSAINITTQGTGTHTCRKGVLLTLPTSSDNDDRIITFVKEDSGTSPVVVACEGSETMTGSKAYIYMFTQGVRLTVQSTNANWSILDHSAPEIWDQRLLATDATGAGIMSDLTYNSLIPGETYECVFNIQIDRTSTSANEKTAGYYVRNGTTDNYISTPYFRSSSPTDVYQQMSLKMRFKAIATKLTFDFYSVTNTKTTKYDGSLRGTAGTGYGTFTELRAVPTAQGETTQWN